jgi:hypothetical protein
MKGAFQISYWLVAVLLLVFLVHHACLVTK